LDNEIQEVNAVNPSKKVKVDDNVLRTQNNRLCHLKELIRVKEFELSRLRHRGFHPKSKRCLDFADISLPQKKFPASHFLPEMTVAVAAKFRSGDLLRSITSQSKKEKTSAIEAASPEFDDFSSSTEVASPEFDDFSSDKTIEVASPEFDDYFSNIEVPSTEFDDFSSDKSTKVASPEMKGFQEFDDPTPNIEIPSPEFDDFSPN